MNRSFFDRLFRFLGPERRTAFIGLCLIGALATVLEMLGLAMIPPLITLLQEPTYVHRIDVLERAFVWLGFEDERRFALMVAGVLFALYCIKNIYVTGAYWLQRRFVRTAVVETTHRLQKLYLTAPYVKLIGTNRAVLVRNVRHSVPQAYFRTVLGAMNLAAEGVAVLGIAVVLLLIDPYALLTAVAISTALIFFHYRIIGGRSRRAGVDVQETNRRLHKQLREVLDVVKEIRILGREQYFLNRLYKIHKRHIEVEAGHQFLMQTVRPATEMIMLLTVFGVVGVLLLSGEKTGVSLPGLAAFAVAGIRLVPILNRVIGWYGNLVHGRVSMETIVDEFDALESEQLASLEPVERLPFENVIEAQELGYVFPDDGRQVLHTINVKIEHGQFVGIVGRAGTGKSTFMDLIVGLITPTQGKLLVDGKDIQTHTREWQNNIGYVPQLVQLTDESLRRNVAFGISSAEVDDKRVLESLRLAKLDALIDTLPQGLDTPLREQGIRLSGGERKRVGIARALYGDPQVLVLDEATADLDNETEQAFTQTLLGLKGHKTIIVIAHRLRMVEGCDTVLLMEDGTVVDTGPPAEVFERHPELNP